MAYSQGSLIFAYYVVYILYFSQLLEYQIWRFRGNSQLVEIGYTITMGFFTNEFVLLSMNAVVKRMPRYAYFIVSIIDYDLQSLSSFLMILKITTIVKSYCFERFLRTDVKKN